MQLNDSPRVALVTGAAGGIGLAVARRFFEMGLRICVWDAHAMRADSVNADTRNILVQKIDVTDYRAVTLALAEIRETWGAISILVNNAGISPKSADGTGAGVLQVDLEQWRHVVEVNLTAPMMLIQQVAPDMIAQRWGRVINIASQAARTRASVPGVAYVCSKTAVLGLSRYAADELGPFGVTVNTLAPGRITSPMTDVVKPEVNAAFVERTPVRRLGTPEDVATAASFYITEQASFLNGTVLDVNGGLYMP